MKKQSLKVALAMFVGIAPALVSGCGDGSGNGNGSPETPQALRESIPAHGGNPGPQAETTYVGKVESSDALIAVVANDLAATAYVCDGRSISEWFSGTPSGSSLQLTGEKGGNVDAEFVGDGIDGEVVHADIEYGFSAETAVERENGIYRSVANEDGERIVSGWIYYDGDLRGADEDSGKTVVGTINVSGIDITGSGTALGDPEPLPEDIDCDGLWCNHEGMRCHIIFMVEERAKLTGAKRKQADAMIKGAQSRLSQLGDDLFDGGCTSNNSACSDTGYNSGTDTPCCDDDCLL